MFDISNSRWSGTVLRAVSEQPRDGSREKTLARDDRMPNEPERPRRTPNRTRRASTSPPGKTSRTNGIPEGRMCAQPPTNGKTNSSVLESRSITTNNDGSKSPAMEGTTGMSKATVETKPGKTGKFAKKTRTKNSAPIATVGEKPTNNSGRQQALDRALGQIEKAYGKGSIMTLDKEGPASVPGVSTGTISLDLALGGRGLPKGRVVEVFGPESSGKTTLALTVIANAQKQGGVAAFIDAEHALDPSWSKKLGVQLDELLLSQPDTGEQALEICEMLVRSNAVDVIVVDSVAALIPRAEIEGDMGDSHVGLQARLMSQALRKLTGAIARSECIVIFINQLREKIGVMFGSPETTTGGRALKFYSSVRLDIRRIGAIKDGEQNVGNRVRAKVVKNKMAPPFRQAEFDIMFNEGISASGDLIDLAVEDGFVQKSGAWFSCGEIRMGQGRENAKQFLRDNPELFDELRSKIMANRLMDPAAAAEAEAEAKAGETPAAEK